MTGVCPTCGQRVLIRHGVELSPHKAAVLDLIEDASRHRGGIELATLAWVLYPGVSEKHARDRVKVHVNQLNGLLAATDFKVISSFGLYRFVGPP
jgi:hypothetical protein